MLKTCLIALFAVAVASAAFADPPFITFGEVRYKSGWNHRACMKEVEAAVREFGFDVQIEVFKSGVRGHNRTYSTAVYCVTDRRRVLAIVAGPDFREARAIREDIMERVLSG